MKRKDSGQILALKRLLSLCNEHQAAVGFTLDDIARWPPIKKLGIKRNSLSIAFRRFGKLGIVNRVGADFKKRPLFRIKSIELANSYIEHDPKKPWLPPTPTPPIDDFPEVDEHKDHFDIELTQEWFAVLKHHATVSNNQYTWRHKSFSLSVNGSSLRGQLYIKPYWRGAIIKSIGQDFYDYIKDLDDRGMRKGDFCLPFGVKGDRITLGGRPTQFSTSHYDAQLDVQCRKNDKNVRDGLYGVTDQAHFNVRILDQLDAVIAALEKQGEVQTRNTAAIERLVKLLSPVPEPEYKQDDKKDDGMMFG